MLRVFLLDLEGRKVMYTLFLDTHSTKIVVVLYKDLKVLVKKEIVTTGQHSITTMPIIVEVIEEANIDVKNLNEILVVNGPGSFTGVRIGVTIAKTLAYTLHIPIKVMSSLLVKAVSFEHENVTIVEAEKNGVFIGSFNSSNELISEYQYVSNKDYSLSTESFIEDVSLNYEKIIFFAKTISSVSPHAVNPLYVKRIEVQK